MGKLFEPGNKFGVRLGNIPDQFKCRATSKSTGKRCQCIAAQGQGLCRHHGAKGLQPTRAKLLRQAARLRGERPKGYYVD